jgi:Tfp pilus assembly protein PilF
VGEWPARPDYRANLGVALFFLGQPEAALAACAQALKIDPDFARAYGIMGSIFEDAGDRSQAQRAYREALKRDPNDPKVRGRLRALEEKC